MKVYWFNAYCILAISLCLIKRADGKFCKVCSSANSTTGISCSKISSTCTSITGWCHNETTGPHRYIRSCYSVNSSVITNLTAISTAAGCNAKANATVCLCSYTDFCNSTGLSNVVKDVSLSTAVTNVQSHQSVGNLMTIAAATGFKAKVNVTNLLYNSTEQYISRSTINPNGSKSMLVQDSSPTLQHSTVKSMSPTCSPSIIIFIFVFVSMFVCNSIIL